MAVLSFISNYSQHCQFQLYEKNGPALHVYG